MANCKHCGGEIQDGALICPHCQKRQAGGSGNNAIIVGGIACGCIGLIVLLGIVAAILVPNLLDALQKAKQKRTVADMRATGTALMSWLTDQVDGSGSGAALPEHPSAEELAAVLVPEYLQELPATDAWKHPFEYWVNPDLMDSHVFEIRSPGRDGVFQSDSYEPAPFLTTDYDQDIVWADGYFVRWPQGTGR